LLCFISAVPPLINCEIRDSKAARLWLLIFCALVVLDPLLLVVVLVVLVSEEAAPELWAVEVGLFPEPVSVE
jgi:hypothetical protein